MFQSKLVRARETTLSPRRVHVPTGNDQCANLVPFSRFAQFVITAQVIDYDRRTLADDHHQHVEVRELEQQIGHFIPKKGKEQGM